MSQSRSVSRSVSGGTVSVDAGYAQDLLDFWVQKYEQVKRELDYIKETSVPPSSEPPSRESSYNGNRESEPKPTAKNEEGSELETLRTCNEDLKNSLAANEKQCSALLEELRIFLAQNAMLVSETDAQRRQKIDSIYPPAAFLPANHGANPPTARFSSLQEVSEKLSAGIPAGHTPARSRICFVPRPPACLPLKVSICGRHGYWFSPATIYPEDLEFELVVEGKPSGWMYLGRYMSVPLPGEEMRLCEWLALDDETKDMHCTRTAAQRFGQHAASPARLSTAATELRQQYDAGKATVPCFTLVCTGFTMQVYGALQSAATRTRKRESDGQAGGKRVKREAN